MKDYTFLSRADYFWTLADTAQAVKRGERVVVATMDIDPFEPAIVRIVTALQTAAANGADVHLIVDAHNFLQSDNALPGPLFYKRSLEALRGRFGATLQLLRALETAGGAYHITNIPKQVLNPPPVGRSHIKGAVVGDRIFIGGCNLERPKLFDIMVTWHSQPAADLLTTWFRRMVQHQRVRDGFGDVDIETPLDATSRLILDAGVPRQSLIYDEALRLIDQAEAWVYLTCQYFPGGETARHLAAAHKRGVKVEIDYSHPRAFGNSATLHHLHQLSQHTRRLPRGFFNGRLPAAWPKLHAKVLATDKGAMVGSHNYVPQGVRFGTAEIALASSDPQFAHDIADFMRSQLSLAASMKQHKRKTISS